MVRLKIYLPLILVFVFLWTSGYGAGILVPSDKSLPPLSIHTHRVEVDIVDQVATTHITQVFRNNVNRILEGTYVFPLPKNAAVSDFVMMVNGEKVHGELVEAGKARDIYERIVRQARDPGLLEYMDNNLLRARVYPIQALGDQEIEIKYTEFVPYDSGLVQYVYPLAISGSKSSKVQEDFTLSVRLSSMTPIKTIYSPTHEISLNRKGDHKATVGFEEYGSELNKDFILVYTLSDKDFGINMLTHRQKGDDGYFLLMIAPDAELNREQVIAKDVVFVVDTSGSMRHENKIEQARDALAYCVKSLNEDDRFNIIRFATDIEPFENELVPADADVKARAGRFIKDFRATGGTNIHEALQLAMRQKRDNDRPFMVVFMTDGKPTIGVTDKNSIIQDVAEELDDNVRVFPLGVGYDVNTILLDRLADDSNGNAEYIKPEENIESRVSRFYDRISFPVLTDIEIDFGKADVRKLCPKKIPDLFHGGQLMVAGRYTDKVDTAITVTGMINGEKVSLVNDVTFPGVADEYGFISEVWAARRVGYLLEEIRLNGEDRELKDEVMRLSRTFGIMTPYTSYLVVEDEKDLASLPPEVIRSAHMDMELPKSGYMPADDAKKSPGMFFGYMESSPSGTAGGRSAVPMMGDKVESLAGISSVEEGIRQESGSLAVSVSEEVRRLKTSTGTARRDGRNLPVKHVSGKTFYKIGKFWVDSEYKEGYPEEKITAFSVEYFELIKKHPELRKIIEINANIIVLFSDKALIICEEER